MKSCRELSKEAKVMIGLAEYKLDDIPDLLALIHYDPIDWYYIYEATCRNPYKMKERYEWYCKCKDMQDYLWKSLYA